MKTSHDREAPVPAPAPAGRKLQIVRDEIANTVTHGIGLALSIAGVALLLFLAISKGDARHIGSFAVFGTCLVATYAISTIYHSARSRRRKLRLRMLDHCAIFLLIAGSYTPFMIIAIGNGLGWTILAIVWAIAIVGIAGKIFVTNRASRGSTLIYIIMGWIAVPAIVPLYNGLGWQGFLLLVAGGLAYTGGTYFFARSHQPYFHAIWHVFVLAGSAFHFAAVALFLLPPVET